MKITSVEALGLFGKSPKGGWSNEALLDISRDLNRIL